MKPTPDIDFAPAPQPKCVHCGRKRSDHKAGTHACPVGERHRSVGWTQYHATNTFTAVVPKKRAKASVVAGSQKASVVVLGKKALGADAESAFDIPVQGAVIVNSVRVKAIGPDIVALSCDLKTKNADIGAHSESDGFPGVLLDGANAVHIDESRKGTLTEIRFTDFPGWEMHSASVGRYTLRVCLVSKGLNAKTS